MHISLSVSPLTCFELPPTTSLREKKKKKNLGNDQSEEEIPYLPKI